MDIWIGKYNGKYGGTLLKLPPSILVGKMNENDMLLGMPWKIWNLGRYKAIYIYIYVYIYNYIERDDLFTSGEL